MTGKSLHPATLAAQALGWTDGSTGAVVLPVHTATTYLRDPDNQYRRGRSYGRADNPSYDQLQALLTALEGGAASLVFSSGMAAAAAVFQSLRRDAHVVAPQVMYWGLRSWLKNFADAWGLEATFVDATSLDPQEASPSGADRPAQRIERGRIDERGLEPPGIRKDLQPAAQSPIHDLRSHDMGVAPEALEDRRSCRHP